MCTAAVSPPGNAARHGITRALIDYDATLKSALSQAGFVTRDAREVERKKVGLRSARRAKQFSSVNPLFTALLKAATGCPSCGFVFRRAFGGTGYIAARKTNPVWPDGACNAPPHHKGEWTPMRLRLLRRRLTISAPVWRCAAPCRGRCGGFSGVVVWLLCGRGLWAFEFGRSLAGLEG